MAHSHNEGRETASESGVLNQTRRRVLKTAAAGSALAVTGFPTSAQTGPIELGGVTAGWEGRAPESIAGETNPTLELQAGQTYAIEWENVDGLPHNVVIEDAAGTNLVRSEIISEEGATQTVEFEATSEMAEYYCEVHPQSMRGEIAIGEMQESGGGAEQTQDAPRFFERGTEVGVSRVVDGMTAPTDFAMDADDRMFVADQTGELWIVDGDGGDGGTDDGQNGTGQGVPGQNETDQGAGVGNDTIANDTVSNDTVQNGTAQNDTDQNATAPSTGDQSGDDGAVAVGDEPAIDLSDRMVAIGEEFAGSYADPEQAYDERGLLGVELHPEFADNGRLFLHYSAPPNDETPDGWSHVEVVSEFGMADDDSVDPDSEQVLMEFQKPQYNHDGGPMAFGPDGYLLVPIGDGGGANDDMYGHVDDWYAENAGGNGQDTSENLLGGIHRIDVDGGSGSGQDGRPYGIPEDNPLVDSEDDRGEYFSWGWRNPFGITVDSEDRIIAADAGQNLFEEANLVEAGGNYGWNVKEGTHCFSTANPGVPPENCPSQVDDSLPAPRGGEELIDPVVEYPHSYQGAAVGIVIAGGHVYEADAIGDLQGAYVFGDWTRDVERAAPDGRIFAAWPDSTGSDDGAVANGQTGQDGGNATDGEAMQHGANDTVTQDGANDTATENDTGNTATQPDTNDTVTQNGANDTTAQNDTGGAMQNDTNATTPQGGTTQTEGDDAEQVVPRDELWEMEELVIAGGEGGNLHRFVRQFGQGRNGEVFVLVNQRGVPQGDTGAVLELVPPGEGDQIQAPEMEEGEGST